MALYFQTDSAEKKITTRAHTCTHTHTHTHPRKERTANQNNRAQLLFIESDDWKYNTQQTNKHE